MALVACGTGLAAVAVHLALVADTRVPAPFLDDWDALLGFEVYWLRAESLATRLHLLFDPHNEHLLAVPRAIALAVQAATGRFDLTTLNVVGNVCIALLLLALWQGRSRGRHARSEQLVIFLPAVLLVAQPQAWTAVISPTVSLSNLGVMALAAGCFASLASRRRSALAGAVLCAAAAPFCSANGILVAPVAAAVPWLRGERQRALVWTAAAVVFVAAYFALARSDYGASDPRASLGDPLALLHYGLNFVGAAGGFGHAGAAPAVGAALLALLGVAAARGGAARNPAHTAMVLFLLASIGANALLRAHQGADAPLHQPRYRAYAAVLLALAWLLAADTASARVRRRLVPVAIVASLAFWAASTWHGNRSARAAAAELEQGLEIWWETGAGGLRHPDYRKARFFLHAALDRGLLRLPDDWYERFATRPEPIDAATTPSPRRLSLEALREEAGTLLAIGEIQGRSPAGTGGLSLLLADEQGRTWRAPARAVAPTPPAAGARRSRTRSAATGFHALVDTSELAPGQYRVGLALESGERQSVAWSDASVTLAAHGARGYSGSR